MKTTIPFKFAHGGGNAIEGRAATYGKVDLAGDIIATGAFSKTISEIRASNHRLPMLWAHAQQDVVGSWSDLREDAQGLYAVGSINEDVARGREALALVKGGDLSGLSIGFKVPSGGSKFDSSGIRTLSEIHVLEISLCAVPAISNARIVIKNFVGLEAYAEFLHAAGASRREAEFVARKTWPAITAGDHPEIDFGKIVARLDEHAVDRKSWR